MKTVMCYARDLIMEKKKNSIKQLWIIRPNARTLPLVSETIFTDGNGEKSKCLKVGVQGSSAVPGVGLGTKTPEAERFFFFLNLR